MYMETIMTATPTEGPIYNRMSGRAGNKINLNMTFYKNGVPTDPYAIRLVKIYRSSVEDANLVIEIPFPDPDSTEYPFPAIKNEEGSCGVNGSYDLVVDLPCDFPTPDIFIDVWSFIPDITCFEEVTSGPPDLDDESLWMTKCGKFWVFPDGWYADDGLMVPDLGFEPLDVQFRAGEKRWLEVGLMPLPLYDFNACQIMPLIPYLEPTITITHGGCDVIVDAEDMEMGLRQGSYRTNPYVTKYLLDTSRFLRGTYGYQITLKLPDCQTIVSPKYTFTIS